MAQVDFSNAVLDVNGNMKPMGLSNYLGIRYAELRDSNGNQLNSGGYSILTNTPSKVSILYSGTFYSGVSGTEFYLGTITNRSLKVSNISFGSEDAYSFVIDIETSGNV